MTDLAARARRLARVYAADRSTDAYILDTLDLCADELDRYKPLLDAARSLLRTPNLCTYFNTPIHCSGISKAVSAIAAAISAIDAPR